MKRMAMVVMVMSSLVLMSLAVVGCGGPSKPEDVTKAFFEAMAKGDLDTLGKLSCAEERENYLDKTKRMMEMGITIALDAEYTPVSQEGDNAVVHIKGTAHLTKNDTGEKKEDGVDADMRLIKEDGDWKYCEK